MKANYGYTDGSGDYYIAIETEGCLKCIEHNCVDACPQEVFDIIEDDYDDMVAAVVEQHRRSLAYVCAECKPVTDPPPLPCVEACPKDAITHSW